MFGVPEHSEAIVNEDVYKKAWEALIDNNGCSDIVCYAGGGSIEYNRELSGIMFDIMQEAKGIKDERKEKELRYKPW